MRVRKTFLFLVSLLVVATSTPVLAAGEDLLRIPAIFPFDSMTVDRSWLEGDVAFASLPDSAMVPKATDLRVNFTGAFALLPELELGANTAFISRNYDEDIFGSPSGLSDTMVWGKYRFGRQPDSAVSAGAFLSLPTGDEDKGLGSGTTDPGVFISGGVRTHGSAFVEGYVGLRANGDQKSFGFERDGKTSILIGFGGVAPVSPGFEAFASFALETERSEGADSFAQVAVGGRWKVSPTVRLQAQAGVGLADAAPSLMLAFGVVFVP